MNSWFTNFGFKLAESITFARGGGLVDVVIFRLTEDPDYDDSPTIEDLETT